ncbi:MAG: hypothetical protein IT428_10265 [Planctomycetaceae bacterium]|nr:hypothetical protein [Planctomycetaceae bacterium]
MRKRRLFAGMLLLAAAAVPAVRAGQPRGLTMVSGGSGRSYIGVLGAVPSRKVFEFNSPNPDIKEVLQAAGGVTEKANGNVRIVSGGKPGQQVFLTPNTRLALRSGDVLIVDGAEPPRSNIHLASASSNPATIPVALINVMDRPVVMALRMEDASVNKIVGLLNQEPEVANSVKIIPTSRTRSANPGDFMSDRDATLNPGTVLVFNRSELDLARIPKTLPPAVAVDVASPLPAELHASPIPSAPPASNDSAPAGRPELTMTPPAAIESNGPSLLEAEQPFGDPLARATRNTVEVAEAPRATLPRSNPLPRSSPPRTANSLTGAEPRLQSNPPLETPRSEISAPQTMPRATPSQGSARTEFIPPPEAIAEARRAGQVDMLPASPDAGPAVGPAPVAAAPVEPEVVGMSEPIGNGARMIAQNRAEKALASVDHVGISEPLASRPKVALASAAVASDDEDESNMELAAAWGVLGAGALAAATWSYRRRKQGRAAGAAMETLAVAEAEHVEQPMMAAMASSAAISREPAAERIERRLAALQQAPVPRTVTATERILRKTMRATVSAPRTRLQELIANELPIEVEPVRMAGPIEVYGSPRTAPQRRVDAEHPAAVARPHFAMQAAEASAEAAIGASVQAASMPAAPAAAAAAVNIPGGHRVDEPHGDGTASAAMPRPHIGERKSDVLERVLTSVQDGARHVGAPHIAQALASESLSVEGAVEK